VPHFTGKAKIDRIVKEAGFANETSSSRRMYYQGLLGALAPQKQPDGSLGWALPLDPTARVIHMGDITELGDIVAGAFGHPDEAGNGEYLPLVGDFMSFNEIVDTLNRQGMTFPTSKSRRKVSRVPFLVQPKLPRRSVTGKLIPIWVRIRRTKLRSQTK
jgi:NmrA-like family